MVMKNFQRRDRAEAAAKWRLRPTVPEAEARVPDLPKLQAASAQAAGNPLDMVQQGLSAIGNLTQIAQKSGGGVSSEAGTQEQPRATGAAGFMPGEWDWRDREMEQQRQKTPRQGQPGRQPGGLIGQLGGLAGEIMQLARARQRFGEEESVYRQEALERQGEAAIGLGGEAGKWYDALGMKLAGEIKNPILREHFVRYASGRAQAGYDRLMRHEVGQTEALKQLAVAQAPALAAYNAARHYDDPDQVERELNDATWMLHVLGPDDPGLRQAMTRAATERVLGRAVEARAKEPNPDPAGARALMERWRGSFGDEEAARLEDVFTTVERGQRRGAAWDELAADVRHDADLGALRGRFADPDFITRHGLDEDDAAHLAGRLDVAHAHAARQYARDQADGLSRELGGFWEAAGKDPLAAYDRLQTATYLPQEHKDFLRQTLLDPAWTGERREYVRPLAQEAAPDVVPDGGLDPHVMTMEYRPDRDGIPGEGAIPLADTPGKDDAQSVLAADPAAPADPDPHEAWKLEQKGAEQPPSPSEPSVTGSFSSDTHENEKLLAKIRTQGEASGRVISHEEYLQKQNLRSLLDDMADQAFPDTGDMKPEMQARKDAFKQGIIDRSVDAMKNGKDAKDVFADELAKLPGDTPIDWGRVEQASRRPEAFDPTYLKQTYDNSDVHELPQSWRYGMLEREKNALTEKLMDHTITNDERAKLQELDRTMIQRAERRNGLQGMAMDGIESAPDEMDKVGHAALTGAAYALPGAAIGAAAGPGGMASGAWQGFKTGATVGYATKDYSRTAAKTYRELNDYTDENGNKLSENTKQATAAVCGFIAAGADVRGLLGVESMVTKSMGKMTTAEVAQKLLTNPTIRSNIERLQPYIREIAISGGSQLFQNTTKSIGKRFD